MSIRNDLLEEILAATGGGGGGAVDSVNGKTGVVVLDPDDMDDAETRHKFSKVPIRVEDSTVAGTGGIYQLDIADDMVVINVFSVTQDIVIRLPDKTGEVDYMCHIYNQTGQENNVIIQDFSGAVLKVIPPVNAYQPYFDVTQGVTDWTIIHTQGTPIPILSADDYGNMNAIVYDSLLVERFYMTDLGGKFLNTGFTFLGGSTYTLLVTTINKSGVYYQEIEIISTDSDFTNADLRRPSKRAGANFASATAVGWSPVALVSDVKPVVRVDVGQFSTSVTQTPTALGDAGKIIVNYGAGGTTGDGRFTVNPDGTVLDNIGGVEHKFSLTMRIDRTGASGVSIFLGRFMYADDGIIANGVQVNDSFSVKIDDADTTWRESFEGEFVSSQGGLLWFEVARDESGSNSGQLQAAQPTGTLAGWNKVNSASLSITRRETA